MVEGPARTSEITAVIPAFAVHAAPGGLVMPPRPEAADEQRIDDLIAQHLSQQKLEILKQGELVRSCVACTDCCVSHT